MARLTNEEKESAETVTLLPRSYATEFANDFEKTEEEKEFSKFFDEMSQSNDYAKIGAYRVPTDNLGRPSGRKLAYLFEVLAGELTYTQLCSRIRDDHGSGTYRIQVRDEQNVLRKNQTISIEAPKNAETPNSAANMVQQISTAMQEQSRSIEEMLSRNRPQSNFNLKEILSYVAPVAAGLAALGITFKREPQKSTLDMLKEFALIKELFSSNDGDGESNLYSLLEKTVVNFGPAFAQAVAASNEHRPEAMRPQLPRPPVQMQPEHDPMQQQVESMKPQLEILAQQAHMKTDALMVAEFFLDSISNSEEITDEQIDGIEQFLNFPDCFRRCVSVVPALADYSAWFATWQDAMIKGLADMLSEDESETSGLTDESAKSQDAGTIVPEADNAATASDIDGNSERHGGNAGDTQYNVATRQGLEKEPTA
jgi:hypothetical protein